jgi:ribosomal protein L40E
MATTKLARDSLMVAPEKDLPIDLDDADGPADTFIDVAGDDTNVHEVKKLPQNYLESRFLISSVQDEIDSARGTKDVSAAEAQLNEAKVDFEAANYNAALTHSMKARKTLEGVVVTTTAATPELEVAKVAAVAKASEIDQCGKCGAELTKDDQFCGSCGEKAGKPSACTQCNAPLKPTDTFCRKCGKKVT